MNKGEIWLVNLPAVNGHERIGERPALILADAEANIAIAIPLTSNLQALRFPHTQEIKPSKKNGLHAISVALMFQIRAIDKKRIKKKIGEIEESTGKEIDKILKKILLLD